jgi:hypothetical protein
MTEPTKKPPLTDEQKAERKKITEAAKTIADELGETEGVPRATIWRSVKALGVEQAQALLVQAQEIEAGEGMLTADGTRRRTPGGVYLALVRQVISGKDRFFVFGIQKPAHIKPSATSQQSTPPPTVPPFTWADRIVAIQTIGTNRGEARTVKITLIGRLGKTLDNGTFVMATMTSGNVPALPKGLPEPPQIETPYVVFISAKQFKKIAEAAQDTEDTIIIEGWCQPDEQTKGIAVWATNVTSKKIQIAAKATSHEQPSASTE